MSSWLSAATNVAAKLVAGSNLPYDVQANSDTFHIGPWKLQRGKHRKTEQDVTIFTHDTKKDPNNTKLARNALKKLKTLKHPYLIKVHEAEEVPDANLIYMLTEPVTPIAQYLQELREPPSNLVWGIYTLTAAVNFLSIDCKFVHGQICPSSIFVDKGMDWKLGGFELASEAAAADADYFRFARDVLPKCYQSPELAKGNMQAITSLPVGSDWWALGCTIFEIFCGEIRSMADLMNFQDMPPMLQDDYKRMLQTKCNARLRPLELLQNPIFDDDYVSLQLFLEMLNVKDSVEKDRFFSKLADQVNMVMHKDAAQWKVLPALINSLEYGGASAKALEPLLRIAQVLTEAEMQTQVVPTLVKLFSNTDRSMRIPLLEKLPALMPHLSQKVVNDAIFQHISLGFVDTSPVLRELTVKSIVHLAPKFYARTMTQVMRAFAKLQLDEEPAIRTNTTICMGKIAQHMESQERDRVLIPAFCRALQDRFPPGRNAGLLSLSATEQFVRPADAATKVIPHVAPLMLDPEKSVRETALACLNCYMRKLVQASEQMSAAAAQNANISAGQTQSTVTDSDHAVAAAAVEASAAVMKSVNWMASSVKAAVADKGAGKDGQAEANAAGGVSTQPSMSSSSPGGGAASYAPPKPPPKPPPPPAQAAAPAAVADGWGIDDLSGSAFAQQPKSTPPAPLKKADLDPFAMLGKPVASLNLGPTSSASLPMGSQKRAKESSSQDPFAALGCASSMSVGGGCGSGSMGGMAPLVPSTSSAAPTQQAAWDSLDPLSSMGGGGVAKVGSKKPAATRVADDWDKW